MDLDGDGQRDILSGSYSRHDRNMAGLFQVLFGNKDGTFRKAEVLKGSDGEPLIIPRKEDEPITINICTRPFAIDWDGDGQLDLVTGNFAGTFYWFKGEGKGKFAPKATQLLAGKEPLQIKGAHSDPFVIDWDGDGDLDILSGSSEGGVAWAENHAGKGKLPDLAPFKTLIEPNPRGEYGKPLDEKDLTGPTHASRVWVDDINGDGKLDLLVGDSVTLVTLPEGVTAEEAKKKQAEWREDLRKTLAKMNDPKADKEIRIQARTDYGKLYSRRAEFLREEMTGFVWLYLRK